MITTIHQPRAEIFDMFNNLVLLGKGGGVVYCGESKHAASYLKKSSSLNLESYDNPADFVIDAMGLGSTSVDGSFNTKDKGKDVRGGVKKVFKKLKETAMARRNERAGYGIVGGGDGDEEDQRDEYEERGVVLSGNENGRHERRRFSTLAEQYDSSDFAKSVENSIRVQVR